MQVHVWESYMYIFLYTTYWLCIGTVIHVHYILAMYRYCTVNSIMVQAFTWWFCWGVEMLMLMSSDQTLVETLLR